MVTIAAYLVTQAEGTYDTYGIGSSFNSSWCDTWENKVPNLMKICPSVVYLSRSELPPAGCLKMRLHSHENTAREVVQPQKEGMQGLIVTYK